MQQSDPEEVVRVEIETWNRGADSYIEATAKLTSHATEVLFDELRLTKGTRALEVGCGPGHLTKRMADAGADVIGADLAPKMIEVAKKLHPGVEFREANADDLPFEDEFFDATLINFAIHHFARPELACTEIHRVLKPGGRFVFAAPIEQFGFGAFIEGLTAHHTMDALAHGPIYLGATQADYENLLAKAGFGEHHITVHQLSLHLKNLAPLLRVGWTMCELDELPQQTQDAIRESVVSTAAPYKTERGYEFPDRIAVGVATK